jgi:hypothetical protein
MVAGTINLVILESIANSSVLLADVFYGSPGSARVQVSV